MAEMGCLRGPSQNNAAGSFESLPVGWPGGLFIEQLHGLFLCSGVCPEPAFRRQRDQGGEPKPLFFGLGFRFWNHSAS